ncbi:hypothetical protein FA95DRAFT_1597393 [Auriscalpium vulgare]|uniref:Uncharacterized protein n=1 Tax=Auriscalpium vulgare TaxID=40419 RepID=A0ACB8RLA8_9AGAM|nr:hypothetical protein FA95DRAFT_1597393 [Auriscalpium vulgare]
MCMNSPVFCRPCRVKSFTSITIYLCEMWEDDRAANRTLHLADFKATRFEDIKKRLLALNHEAVDIDAIRDLPEVLVAKPISDRAWTCSSQAIILEVQLSAVLATHARARSILPRWNGLRNLCETTLELHNGPHHAHEKPVHADVGATVCHSP